MARIRTIKPEFPQSESMGRVSRDARLLFVELWTICDDHGRTRAHSRMLASLLFPYDDDAGDLMPGWLKELEDEGCIRIYEANGSQYLQVVGWSKHQKIDKPSKPQFPSPDDSNLDALARIRELSSEEGTKEGKGREGRGEEREEKPPRAEPTPRRTNGTRLPADWSLTPERLTLAADADSRVDARREAAKFRDYWLAATGKTAVKADWDATWRNWIRRAGESLPAIHAATTGRPTPPEKREFPG